MPPAERPKPMRVRRTILCLAAAFLWATHDPDMASGQSSELMEAYNSYNALYQQGRYSEAEAIWGIPVLFPFAWLVFTDIRLCRGEAAAGISVVFRTRSAILGRHRTPKFDPVCRRASTFCPGGKVFLDRYKYLW